MRLAAVQDGRRSTWYGKTIALDEPVRSGFALAGSVELHPAGARTAPGSVRDRATDRYQPPHKATVPGSQRRIRGRREVRTSDSDRLHHRRLGQALQLLNRKWDERSLFRNCAAPTNVSRPPGVLVRLVQGPSQGPFLWSAPGFPQAPGVARCTAPTFWS